MYVREAQPDTNSCSADHRWQPAITATPSQRGRHGSGMRERVEAREECSRRRRKGVSTAVGSGREGKLEGVRTSHITNKPESIVCTAACSEPHTASNNAPLNAVLSRRHRVLRSRDPKAQTVCRRRSGRRSRRRREPRSWRCGRRPSRTCAGSAQVAARCAPGSSGVCVCGQGGEGGGG